MQVTQTHADGLTREYKVVVDAQELDQKMQDRLQEIGRQARIPGFRPGKAPMQILRQRFGQAVRGEILEKAINETSQQAMQEQGLRPAMQPQIEIESYDEGKDLAYKLNLELLPDVEPMDFSQLELERLKVEVPEDEVNEAIERLAERQKETKPLETPRPAQKGDVLVVDFKGTVDGEPYPGMEGEDHHLELGSNRFIEGFEDQLIGAEPGDSRTVTVTFPKTYMNEQLAGKKAVFDVKVKEIRETEPLKIDDELAQRFGEESLESMKQKVREQIEADYAQAARQRTKRELLDKLSDGHDFPVPPSMVDNEFNAIWEQIERDREQGQLDPEDAAKDEETLKAEYRAIAERRVRLGLLLSEVGRENNIEVTQDELNRALVQEAQRHPGHEREVFEHFRNSPEAIANLRAPLFEDKVIDYILELASVKERSVTPEELRREMEAEHDEREAASEKAGGKKKGAKKASAGSGGGKSKKAGAKAASGGKASGGETAGSETS